MTKPQRDALLILSEGPLTDIDCMIQIGRSWKKTLSVLEREGLARFFPHGANRKGCWKITKAGSSELDQALSTKEAPHERFREDASAR
jgi:hypothetical protein